METEFSPHARERLAQRGIPEEAVRDVLDNPTSLDEGRGKRMVATKNGIRVVYIEFRKVRVVVTVTRV